MNYNNIPQELRNLRQWLVWRYIERPNSKKPTKTPFHPIKGCITDGTSPDSWVDFETVLDVVSRGTFDGIGLALTPNDPYAVIDLDSYDPELTKEDLDRHQKIAQTIESYQELSPSGKGLHIVVRASVPEGRVRKGVEVFSKGKYYTFTGNVWRDSPIKESPFVQTLWEELAPPIAHSDTGLNGFKHVPSKTTDDEICRQAASALNGELFKQLFNGNWQRDYPSQSEADYALINIVGFYTQDAYQITRIFRASQLGKRPKAWRNEYVNNMIAKSQDNTVSVDIDQLRANLEATLTSRVVELKRPGRPPNPEPLPYLPPPDETGAYSLPDGLVGQIAEYLYSSAPRPVQEIALAGAIGLMAGICGRSHNCLGLGLNQYLLLIAQTGTGKEYIASGISSLMSEVEKKFPSAKMFLGPGYIASAPALLKYVAKTSPSFVSVLGEFATLIGEMSRPNANSHMKGLKSTLLDFYNKSGGNDILRPSIYSQQENSTFDVRAPAFTLIGENEPESFYETIDERIISSGLLPRFTFIEYLGNMPPLNSSRNHPPSEDLINKLVGLCQYSFMLNQQQGNLNPVQVRLDEGAAQLLAAFEEETRNIVNQTSQEHIKKIWTRSHAKAMKLAALIAVGTNQFSPVMTESSVQWAIKLIRRNTVPLISRFDKGTVGGATHDGKQTEECMRMFKNYLAEPWESAKKYSSYEQMHAARVVPYSYISKRLVATSAFRTDRLGATNAINRTIKGMIESGYIVEMLKQDAFNRFGVTARCFAICNPSAFA